MPNIERLSSKDPRKRKEDKIFLLFLWFKKTLKDRCDNLSMSRASVENVVVYTRKYS